MVNHRVLKWETHKRYRIPFTFSDIAYPNCYTINFTSDSMVVKIKGKLSKRNIKLLEYEVRESAKNT